MSFQVHIFAGVVAGLLSLLAGLVYIFDIIRHRAQPHRGTWWVLGILNCGITLSYYSAGAFSTIWLPAEYAVTFLIVAVLSIKYGEGRWRALDTYCLIGGMVAALGWWLTRSASVGLALFTLADFLGLAPTISKAYRRPQTERSFAWPIGAAASLLNVLAIDQWSPEISVYPLYVFGTSVLIVYFIYRPDFKMREVTPL